MSNLCRINVECMSKTTCDTTCGTLHVSICWASYEYLQNCNVGIVLALHQPTFPARKDATTVPLADSALCTHGPRIRCGCTLPIGPLHMRKVLRFGCVFRGYSASCRHNYQRRPSESETKSTCEDSSKAEQKMTTQPCVCDITRHIGINDNAQPIQSNN